MANAQLVRYRDAYGNPLTKKDVGVAVQAVCMNGGPMNTIALNRCTTLGITKSYRILNLLVDAGVVDVTYKPLFKGLKSYDQALNAALRQLKKGKK